MPLTASKPWYDIRRPETSITAPDRSTSHFWSEAIAAGNPAAEPFSPDTPTKPPFAPHNHLGLRLHARGARARESFAVSDLNHGITTQAGLIHRNDRAPCARQERDSTS